MGGLNDTVLENNPLAPETNRAFDFCWGVGVGGLNDTVLEKQSGIPFIPIIYWKKKSVRI